jgi:hypothetical protein
MDERHRERSVSLRVVALQTAAAPTPADDPFADVAI